MGEHKYTKARVERLESLLMEQVQKLNANNAIIAAVLEAVGATEDKPVCVDQEKIKEAVQGKYVAMVGIEEGVYRMHCRENAEETGEEAAADTAE